jgi:phosphocarrier protein
LFVEIANKYNVNVKVRKKDLTVDGRSIMGLLMLEAGKGTKVELIIEGKEAEAALKEFKELLKNEHISE